MGRKALDLNAVKAAHGSWVAELGLVSFLTCFHARRIKAWYFSLTFIAWG